MSTNNTNNAGEEMTATDLVEQTLSDAASDGNTLSASPKVQSTTPPTGIQAAQTLTSLQNLIERNALELDQVLQKVAELRESLKSVFENDTEMAMAEEQVRQVAEHAKVRKSTLQQSPQVLELKNKLAELAAEKKEIEATLDTHLLSLYTLTRSKTVDLSSGEREFSIRASLKRKKAE